MPVVSHNIIELVQAVSGVVTAVAVIFAFLQVRLSAIQLKKQQDQASIEFVLNSWGQFDPMWGALVQQDGEVIRHVFETSLEPGWTDADAKAYVWLERRYAHVSRIVYVVSNMTLDLGMTRSQREAFLNQWKKELIRYKDNKIMNKIHKDAMVRKNYNDAFLKISKEIFEA